MSLGRRTSVSFAPLAVCLMLGAGCASLSPAPANPPATRPGPTAEETAAWTQIAAALGKPGVARDGVYTVVFPRDDLFVSIDGMDVPTAAGIESVFRFYRCSCGRTVVIGQFVVADYEANDVAYALEKEDFNVSSMAPLLLYEKPRLLAIRFQAEGDPRRLAEALRDALNRTGKSRLPPPATQ